MQQPAELSLKVAKLQMCKQTVVYLTFWQRKRNNSVHLNTFLALSDSFFTLCLGSTNTEDWLT